MKQILAALAALALSAFPATAFDQLERFVAIVPDVPQNPLAFTYVAPRDGFVSESPTLYGVEDATLLTTLIDAEGTDATTGIAFSQVTGVLSTGQPPRQLTVLFGQPGFLGGSEAALLARGFTASEIGGLPILSKGEDYALDLASASNDPLGSGMGKAQRLALGDDFLLRTAGWPELRMALASLDTPPPATELWRATISGLRQASGESTLEVAFGWNAVGFLDIGDPAEIMLDPTGAKTASKQPSAGVLPLFPHAIIALTRDDTSGAVRIALPFAVEDQAEAAGAEIAARLLANPATASAQPSISVEPVAPYFVAVVTVEAQSLAEAVKNFSGQNGAVMQRNYDILRLAP